MNQSEKQHYRISFQNGTVGNFSEPMILEDAKKEMLERCEQLNMGANLLNVADYAIVSTCIINSDRKAVLTDVAPVKKATLKMR